MRIYSLQAPDGNIYDLQAPEGASEQELTATLYSLKPEAAQPFVKESGVIAQAKKGIEQLVSGAQTTAGVAFGDKNEAARDALARQAEFDRKYEQNPSLERTSEAFKQKGFFSGLGQLASDAPEVLAAQIPQFGAAYAGGRLGAAAGSKLGSVLGPRGRLVGSIAGGLSGAFGVNYPAQFAGDVETQAEEQVSKGKPIDINVPAAAGAATVQAGLDTVANLPFFGRNVFGKMLGLPEAALARGSAASVEKLAQESLAATVAKGTAIGFAAEFPTEVLQQVIQRYQAGQPLTSPEAYKEYGEIAYQTALLSPLGTAGRALDKRAAKADVQQKAIAEQQIADAEAQKAAQEVAPVQPQDIAGRYQAAEKRKAELKAQIRKVEEGSVTETADRLYNKELEEQIKAMAPELEQLATEYNQFQKTAPAPEAAAPEVAEAAPEEVKPARALTVGDSLDSPLGRFTKEELTSRSPKIAAYVDMQRKKMGKPGLNDYSIEDLRDAMPGQLPEAEKADLNSLIAAKTGYTGEVIYKPEDVVNIAKQKNINTDTVGFKYFLQRATGDNDLSNMSQPQLHSAFKSLSELPKYEETQNLPEKSSATHYSPEQYKKAVETIKNLTTDGILPSAKAQAAAKQASGLKRDSDVQYMLQSAYRNGDLDLDSQGNFIRVNPAPQSEFRVEEGFEPAEPTGFNVMRGDKVLFSTQNEAEAKAKAKTLGDSAAPTIKQVEKSIANEQKALDASQRSLDAMEANGLFGTPEYNKASAKHTALVEESAKKVGELSKTKEYLQQEVTVKAGKKAANVKAYTTKEKGVSEKSFATREEALQHAIENHTVARLNEIAAETKSPGLKNRISKELERRKGTKPFLAAEKPVQEPVQKTAEKPAEKPLVTAQKESIKSQLLPMLKKFGLGDVALQIEEGMKAEGSYTASTIKVALDANNPIRVLRHESLHGLKDLGFFTKGQWAVLENQADKVWIDKYLKERNIDGRPLEAGQQSRYEAYIDLYQGDMQAVREEAIADAFGDFDVNGAPKGVFTTLLNNMRQFFEALRNSFNGAGYMTSDDVFGKIERGELSAGNKAGTTEKPSLTSGNAFDKAEVAKAKAYEEKNGIAPYLSVGEQYLPTTGGEKYSLKTKDKYGMYEGIPLNNDGTITVYYHTTKANAMDINKAKRISPSDDKRVYLTNESSGALVLKNKGLLPQETDGSVVMLKLPPEMMQFAEKYSDGRVDMFIPLAEGDFFDEKMRVSAIQVSKDKAILEKGQTFSYKDHAARMSGALTAYEGMSAEGKKQAVKRAAEVLREQHNIGTLLTTNGKLEKTSPEAEGLSDLDVNASSMGLGLASAQKITEKLSSCPNSAICVDLCLGDTAGGNQQYGGVAKEDVGDIEKSAFRAGPRMVQYLKTEALIIHPEEFALVLSDEIQKFKEYERSTTIKQKNPKTGKMEMVEAEVYEPSIRLNVTSDFAPEMFKPLFDAHPDVVFYDYTKLQGKPIAENHHLTYSSTGFAQMIDGKLVQHKTNNWNAMRGKLDSGYNVAMAFTSKSALPKTVMDEETGKSYQVWDGDNYDARYLDPKRPDGVGMIVGLRNKAGTMKERESAAQTDGFFVNYDPKTDGDTVSVPDQKALTGRKVIPIAKASLRTSAKESFASKPAVLSDDMKAQLRDAWMNDSSVSIPVDMISIPKSVLDKVLENFDKSRYSKSDGPIDVWLQSDGHLLVTDGNHRYVKAVLDGKKEVEVSLLGEGYSDNYTEVTDKNGVSASPSKEKASLRTAPDTPEFKRFFGDSKIVNADGTPKVMYHGLAKDTTSFKRKSDRGAPIFLTDKPEFAERFAKDSFDYVASSPEKYLSKEQINSGIKKALVAIRKDYGKGEQAAAMMKSITTGNLKDATPEAKEYLRNAFKDMLPTGPHIMPVYVRAENPFNYANTSHVNRVLAELSDGEDLRKDLQRGSWETIESEAVQDAIKFAGFDSFYVLEHGVKNLAVYDSSQLKSVTGNVGAYGQRPVTKEEAARSGMTEEEAQKAQAEGDVRYSLRTDVSEDIKNMPNGAAIFAAINRTTQTRQEVGFIERMASIFQPESFGYLRQKALDRYDRLSAVEKELAKQMGGVERLADSNAHAAALQSDLAAGVAASALGVGDRIGGIPVYKDGYTTVSNEGGTVKGAVAIFAPLARHGDPKMYQAYQFWAASKRGKRLLASGKEELFTPQDFAYAKQLEQKYPEFVSVQKDWIKYNDGLVKYAVDTGVISAQNAAEFVKYSDYLPFYRQIEGERTIGPNIFQSISGVKAPKKITGSEAPLADFLETIVRNTQATIQAGMKNVAAKKAADAGVMIGMVQKLDHVSSSPNTITILEKGQKVSYECADRLWVDAVSSLNLPELPFLSIFAKPADILRNMITKDPGFMLANLMRDSVSAYVTSGANITPLVSTVKEFGSVLIGSSPEYQKLLSAGVLGGYEFSRDIEASTSEFAKDIRKKTGTKTTFEKSISPFTFFWNGLEKGTNASDAATRIAIYKATLKETGNEAEALHRSLEVMNFNRKGSSAVVRIAAAVIPFLNARVQGLDVFLRSGIRPFFNKDATAMEKQVQKAMFIRGSTIMAMSAMYAAAISGNPDYEKQEEEVKDNNWIIPLGEGKAPLKIPIPFEVGTLFKTLPERIYRSFHGDTNKDSAEAAKRALSNTFGVSPLPQFIAPYYEVKSNYSLYTGREIVSGNMKDVAPEYQVGANTSKVAEYIGMETGMSPMKIEYLYKGYTGTMGMYALDVLDASITSLMPNSGVEKASKRFEQMPVIKRFFADPEARGQITAYYDLKNSVDSVVRTINFLEKSNDPSIADYAQKNAMLYAAKDFINSLNKDMQDLQDQANMIRAADIPADQKRDILLEITKAQNLLVNDIRAVRKAIQP